MNEADYIEQLLAFEPDLTIGEYLERYSRDAKQKEIPFTAPVITYEIYTKESAINAMRGTGEYHPPTEYEIARRNRVMAQIPVRNTPQKLSHA